jgi:hypothetical protein
MLIQPLLFSDVCPSQNWRQCCFFLWTITDQKLDNNNNDDEDEDDDDVFISNDSDFSLPADRHTAHSPSGLQSNDIQNQMSSGSVSVSVNHLTLVIDMPAFTFTMANCSTKFVDS